jgi:putative DNA primase/helicase
MTGPIDFDGINRAALSACPGLLQRWFPAGRLHGQEFRVGDLAGKPGESLSINTVSGKWSDFAAAPPESGGDLISLYAAIHKLDQGEAARGLAAEIGIEDGSAAPAARRQAPAPEAGEDWRPQIPPPGGNLPKFITHGSLGPPDHRYDYLDAGQYGLFVVCRWDATARRGKVILPLVFGIVGSIEGWHWKHPPPPRPLFGLEQLRLPGNETVLIVEGEKTAIAVRPLVEEFAVLTWPGGTNAAHLADWSPLKGWDVVIWPDADRKIYPEGHAHAGEVKPDAEQPGIKAAELIAAELSRLRDHR